MSQPATEPAGPPAVVVDDWPLVRFGVARVLDELGLAPVVQTASGRTGVLEARASGAAVLVVGAHSDQSPVDTVRAAKAEGGPRVVVLMARTEPGELRDLLAAGADALVLRTVDHVELSATVAQVLAGQKVVANALVAVLYGAKISAARTSGDDSTLTAKEREVLAELAAGASNKQIAAALHLSAATVKTHLSNIYAKLGVQGRHDAVGQAVARGLLS